MMQHPMNNISNVVEQLETDVLFVLYYYIFWTFSKSLKIVINYGEKSFFLFSFFFIHHIFAGDIGDI